MIQTIHSWQDEKKNFRRLLAEDSDRVEILFCKEHKEYEIVEIVVNGKVYALPMGLVMKNER